jgi:hypothetical protein
MNPNAEHANAGARLEREVNKLVSERASLFDKAGASHGLSNIDQQRLGAIERELDEAFLERRRLRADRDMQRFDRDRPFIRRPLSPKSRP